MAIKKTTNKSTWEFCTRYTDIRGVRKQKRLRGFSTKREAQEAERDFLNSLNYGVLHTTDITVDELAKIYLESRQSDLKTTTYYYLESALKRYILPFFGRLKVSEINQIRVNKFHNFLLDEQNLSLATAKLTHSRLITMLKYAETHCDIPRISHKLKPPKRADLITSSELKFYTKDQMDKLLSHAESTDKFIADIIKLLYHTGLRIGELLALTYNHIDFENNKIIVRQNLGYTRVNGSFQDVIIPPKNKSSIREIVMTKETATTIQRYYQIDKSVIGFQKEWFIFSTHKETPTRYHKVLRYFNKVMQTSNLPKITMHDLRHSHASLLINAGADPLLVSSRLGHTDVTTTLNIYSHFFPERENTIITILDEYLG